MIRLDNVSVTYRLKGESVEALRNASLALDGGSFVAIMGPSGSGKTTLIQVIAGLLTPTAGNVIVSGQNLRQLDDRAISEFRNRTIGFVFQFFNLPSYYTALDNVALPLVFAGVSETERRERARALLDEFGLGDRAIHKPEQLSGGEAQRVAIARALINNPKIILADEPTGNLDRDTGFRVMALLQRINRERNVTVLLVTHDEKAAAFADRVLRIEKGALAASLPPPLSPPTIPVNQRNDRSSDSPVDLQERVS
ncbi:MAG: ABC transporter ATP-binding protein [Verrucomicrobia bacterium]|nr:ABC transporter ATP-binding protein [Verrucomicrobiota bacterium]